MTVTMIQFETENLKLAALILAEIPSSTFKVNSISRSSLKTICIFHPKDQTENRDKFINLYAMKKAKVDLFRFNRALNDLRDSLKAACI